MRKFSYASPGSLEEAIKIAAENSGKEVRFIAGGTDFNPKLHTELDEPPKEGMPDMVIVSLKKAGLDQIAEKDGEICIGACCTMNDLEESDQIRKEFPVLVQAIRQIAGYTIRNTCTLGGNIVNASPAADSVPALIVLGAKFKVCGSGGEKEYAAEDFFTGPGKTRLEAGEVLTEIVIPKGSGKGAFIKLGKRKAETLSTVNAAAYIEQENGKCTLARVAVGAAAPTVVKCTAVEQELAGKELTDEVICAAAEKAVEQISPIDDVRASAWYRRKVAPVVVRRVIQASV